MRTLEQPQAYLQTVAETLQQQGHRTLCLLQGDTQWALSLIQPLCNGSKTLTIGQTPLEKNWQQAQHNNLKHFLGQEFAHAVITLNREEKESQEDQGLRADSLGIVSGMIRAGGFLFIIVPALWPEADNPEDQRFLNSPLSYQQIEPWFYRQLAASWQEDALWIQQQAQNALLLNKITCEQLPQPNRKQNFANGAATEEQNQAIQKILKVAFGHRKRPLILSADRGRGKSAALGLAAIQALIEGKKHIAISASLPEQTQSAFTQATQWLQQQNAEEFSNLQSHKGLIEFSYQGTNRQLKFYAPDYLHLYPIKCDLLLIDEAAQIPTPLLTGLLKQYHRTVFSTTLHGYEGSGRGFELRFTQTLNQLTPDWNRLHLLEPLRWNADDPLEKAINRSLLLQAPDSLAAPPQNQPKQQLIPQIQIKQLDKNELIARLPQIFGLLVKAHYQTSPNDLQQLLNAPNDLWIALYQEQVIGVLLSQQEGGLDKTSKIHGHLVPQLLNRQYAFDGALSMTSWRLMRIAVEPQWQSLGIGSKLVTSWQDNARSQHIDFISSSFGAETSLINFWFRQGMQPLHLGCKRDKASGSYNLLVYQALNSEGAKLETVRSEFYQQLPCLLADELKELEITPLQKLLKSVPHQNSAFPSRSWQVIELYLQNQRAYSTCKSFIYQLTIAKLAFLAQLETFDSEILIDKTLKQLSWAELARKHRLNGKKQAEQAFKAALEQFIKKGI